MSAYSDKVIADGAVAYWRLGEPSGTVANSEVGTFPGTISGGVTLNQPGAIADGSKAMTFDGTDDRIAVPKGSYSNFGVGPFTVECWVDARVNKICYVLDIGEAFGPIGVSIKFDANGILLGGLSGGQAFAGRLFTDSNYHARPWIHLVAVFTRGSQDVIKGYVNGAATEQTTLSAGQSGLTFTTTSALSIGSYVGAAAGDRYFDGSLDDLALYQAALTPAQIAAHYDEGSGIADSRRRRRRRFRAHAC